MSTRSLRRDAGRPRDPRIDAAVLVATRRLLTTKGYAGFSVADLAHAAGTTKPAIYRRWPSKAHVVHEAVFPADARMELPPAAGPLEDQVRSMVAGALAVLSTPAAQAALPGLVAELAADRALHARLLGRLRNTVQAPLAGRLEKAVAEGMVRADVDVDSFIELLAGTVVLALLTRSDQLGEDWVDRTAALITRGIRA
jgi:AcrR family transcriptional regulator